MAIEGLKRMIENRGAETWDLFMDNNIISPIENKINQLEENGGLDQETKDKIDEIVKNGVSTNLYNPADTKIVIYVNQNLGNDTTGDGSIDKPYATLEKAWKRIPLIVTALYTIKFIGNYSFNSAIKCSGKWIVNGKGSILITSNDVENRSNISSNYYLYFHNIISCFNVSTETSFFSNFEIKDINIGCSLQINDTNITFTNFDNIKTDSYMANIKLNNCHCGLVNCTLTNGKTNIEAFNTSTLYCVNSNFNNQNGVNINLDFFSNGIINKNCELVNSGSPVQYTNGCTLINKVV